MKTCGAQSLADSIFRAEHAVSGRGGKTAEVSAYVRALGGEVEIVAKFGDERFTIG